MRGKGFDEQLQEHHQGAAVVAFGDVDGGLGGMDVAVDVDVGLGLRVKGHVGGRGSGIDSHFGEWLEVDDDDGDVLLYACMSW